MEEINKRIEGIMNILNKNIHVSAAQIAELLGEIKAICELKIREDK
jgi:hypothetical protein